MPTSLLGLPIHPLIVHATVVVVPTAAVVVGLAAVYRRFRVWAGPLPLLLALLSVVLAPLSTSSGEELRSQLGDSHLIEQHAELAGTLLWFVIGLAVVAAATYLVHRRRAGARALTGLVSVVSVVVAAATLVDVALIGHSGAQAAWHGVAPSTSSSAQSGHGGG